MSRLIARRRVLVAIILVLLAIVTTETVALAATLVQQGTVQTMKVASTASSASTTSTSWTDVPGTALAVPVPSGEHDFFQATFSASPGCYLTDPTAPAYCRVRVLVDGQLAQPGAVNFGESSLAQSGEPVTMQWLSPTVLAPGTHYVKVQWALSDGGNEFVLAGRTLTVVRVKAY